MKKNKSIKLRPILSLVLVGLISTFFVSCDSDKKSTSSNVDSNNLGGKPRDFESVYKGYIAMKKDYLKERVGLDPADTIAFFEVYEQMQKERMAFQRKLRDEFRQISFDQIDSLDNEQCLDMAFRINTAPSKEAEIKTKYFEILKEMLTPQQLLKLELAEIKFNNHLLRHRKDDVRGRKEDR